MKKLIVTLLVLAVLAIGVHKATGIYNQMESEAETEALSGPREQYDEPQQTATGHLTFKGVPIDGPLHQFVANMERAGFDKVSTGDGTAVLRGDFAGYKGCTVGVSTLKTANLVNTIGVAFPEHDDWAPLEANYNDLKSMLTEKYGTPSDCVEEFHGLGSPKSNGKKTLYLKMDKYTWYTVFSTPKGNIQLSIDKSDYDYFVMLRYYDRANTSTVKARALEDL